MEWVNIYIDYDDVLIYQNERSTKFYIKNGEYEGFSFWHPNKLVNAYGDVIEVRCHTEWQFELKRSEKRPDGTYEVKDCIPFAADELQAVLSCGTCIHVPPHLDPLENVEPLPELLDE